MKTKYLAAALMLLSLPATALAAAPSNEDLYNMILELKQELKQSQQANQAAQAEIADLKGTATTPSWDGSKGLEGEAVELDTFFEDSYLTWKSKDDNFKFKIDGRVMLDSGFVQNDKDGRGENDLYVNTEFRRIRFALKTEMYNDWAGEFDIDFADNEVDIKDMWLSYNGFNNTILKLGNHKPAFCMDEVTTSRWTVFMERSMLSDVFSPGRRIGFSGSNYGKHYFAGATVFGDEISDGGDESASEMEQGESYGFATRLVARPIVSDDESTIVHLGFNYMHDRPDKAAQEDDDKMKWKTNPEAHFLDYDFLYTAKVEGVDHTETYGLELAAKWNKLAVQAEYMTMEVSGDNEEPEFDGFYVQASYFLTNDERPYNLDDGEFGAIKPKGKHGAWEVAARYSNLNLNDSDSWGNDEEDNGGKADAITLALNWYINNNFMVKTNYLHVEYDENATGKEGKLVGDDELDVLGVRFQYLF